MNSLGRDKHSLVYVVVKFYPRLKFYFPLFQTHYPTLPTAKQRKIKFKPRIKLNHNICKLSDLGYLSHPVGSLSRTFNNIHRRQNPRVDFS